MADRMGEIIVRLSSGLQVINITHLPQVAAKGATTFSCIRRSRRYGDS
ncbi:MAG: hypothetical protein ACLR76_05775 [Alistipes sp.]